MKTIKFITRGNFKTKDVLTQVLQVAPNHINVEQMRQRCNILNELEKSKTSLTLEDAPYNFLCGVVNAFPFQVALPDLLAVIDSILTPQKSD